MNFNPPSLYLISELSFLLPLLLGLEQFFPFARTSAPAYEAGLFGAEAGSHRQVGPRRPRRRRQLRQRADANEFAGAFCHEVALPSLHLFFMLQLLYEEI